MPERPTPPDDALPSKARKIAEVNLQATLAAIPVAGSFLATYFGEIRGDRLKERMQLYFDYFSECIRDLYESKVDHAYLHTEEFAEYFVQGAEQAARSTTEERIRRFANILANNALLDAKNRDRTQSIMSFVDRIGDLDAFVLLSFGNPRLPPLRAQNRTSALEMVSALADYLAVDSPTQGDVVESIVYLDNLGLMWVNEQESGDSSERGADLILKEFSCFRTPLGDAVASVIAAPGFYRENGDDQADPEWPGDHIAEKYCNGAGL